MTLSSLGKSIWRAARMPLLLIALAGTYFGGLQLVGNFHTVVPGEVYRAAQVDAEDIAEYKQRYGIRSVLNLRGENPGSPWYDKEAAAVKDANITHLNFRMAAKRELTEDQGKELIELMRNAPKPMLIHCKSGADRTGLASALYLAAIEKKPEAEAAHELSALYGHLSIPFLKEYAMDRTLDKMKPSLGYPAH